MKTTFSNLIIILFTALCFASCGDFLSNKTFYLDNPTENTVSVTLNGTTYQLPPDHSEKVVLQTGIHQITLPDGQSVKFNIYDKSKGGIINPTRSLYVAHTLVYAINDKASANFITQNRKVYIDGILYQGSIRTISDLFIDKNFINYSYGLRKPYPDKIRGSSDRKGDFRNKLFTKKEFIDFYEKENGAIGFHEQHKVEGVINTPTDSYSPQIPLAKFNIPEMQVVAEKILVILQHYLASVDVKEQKELLKAYHIEYKEIYEKSKPLNSFEKHTAEERNDFNNFMWYCGQVLTTGVAEIK